MPVDTVTPADLKALGSEIVGELRRDIGAWRAAAEMGVTEHDEAVVRAIEKGFADIREELRKLRGEAA